MARKSSKSILPNVGETWVFRNGEKRKVNAIVNGFLIEWTLAGHCGYYTSTSGACDLRTWHHARNPALSLDADTLP